MQHSTKHLFDLVKDKRERGFNTIKKPFFSGVFWPASAWLPRRRAGTGVLEGLRGSLAERNRIPSAGSRCVHTTGGGTNGGHMLPPAS